MSTYRDAGVDLDAADRLVGRIAGDVTATWDDSVVGGFGGFAGGIRMPAGLERPVLMMSTDGVGTKAEVARRAGRVDGLGFDLVAMCADDLAAAGARPIALTDYLTVGTMDERLTGSIIGSVARACRSAGIALLGGETAVHAGILEPDEFDLAGTALGVVDEGRVVDGSAIAPGHAIVAVASPNLRSNGFSLVRTAVLSTIGLDDVLAEDGRTVAEAVLDPSVIYAPAIGRLLETVAVTGLVHVTGGGIAGNLGRILPEGCRGVVDTATWAPPPVFGAVARIGGIARDEMFRTFNMGAGFLVITPEPADAIASLRASGHDAWAAGGIESGEGASVV
ncbi:MAG TPA: phosphoribosylformylglycinamidine cyclo-ligase [Acidimicrobiia bacterium]|nr:phosphoribosylformylglycinamidine cyclo-ligase [Acidimicrobiia bacterium]